MCTSVQGEKRLSIFSRDSIPRKCEACTGPVGTEPCRVHTSEASVDSWRSFSYYHSIMAEDGGGGSNVFIELIESFFKLIFEMLGAFFSVLPKVISFILWIIVAIVILPCVFVAGNLYEPWIKWGEKF